MHKQDAAQQKTRTSRGNRPGLLIFDLDGTLFQAATVTVPAVQQGFQAHGLPVPAREKILSFFGRPGSEFHTWIRSLCPPEQGDALVAAIDEKELALVSETGELYPGVHEVLAELRGMVGQVALCTNGPWSYVGRVLSTHGLEKYLDVVRYRQFDDDNKPAMVRELLARLPGRPALVIGDRWDDVEAAHQNGLRAIAAAYGYGSAEEWTAADAVAHAPADLPGLVRELLVTLA